MKKPIDPNLENLFDDLIGSNPEESAESEKSVSAVSDEAADVQPTGNFEITESNKNHHSSHHSSGEHHHSSSSGEHHHSSSSGEHHHSGSSHHSSGEHHHSSSHHSSGEHHHSSSSHHHSSKKSHRHKSEKKKNKISTAGKIAIAFLIFLLLCIFAVVFAFLYLQHQGKSDFKPTQDISYQDTIEYKGETYVYNDDIISIAFIGVDKRELSVDENKMGSAGQADADIILTINTKTGNARAIAVPRDTMVDIDVFSENGIFLNSKKMQLCLSYAYGDGREKSANNVTTSLSRILYDVPINKYFALDLDGIQAINDAMGGVTLTSLTNFDNRGIKKGDKIHLIGDLTETYVRTRDMDSVEASLERTQRQVQYIKEFTAQLAPNVINDFSIVSRLYNTAMDYSITNISLSNATYLATLLISNGVTSFETSTIEGEMKLGTTTSPDIVYAEFYPDEDKLMELVLDIFYTKK